MTAAQKAAKEKFSKAIAYRTKTGVSLKEAFAHVYGKKVGAVKKKAAPKKKAAVKKSAPKKKAVPKKVVAKKAAPKKAAVKKVISSHKDTKSHNVNIRVVSGVNTQNKKILALISVADEELFDVINDIKVLKEKIIKYKNSKNLIFLNLSKKHLIQATNLKKELEEHLKQLKKNIK